MLYRLNAVFNLPKRRALVVSILCFIAGCILLPTAPGAAGLSWMFFLFGLIYGCVWTVKFCRDMDILIKAEQDYYNPKFPEIPLQGTTSGSNRLFVPKPLDR